MAVPCLHSNTGQLLNARESLHRLRSFTSSNQKYTSRYTAGAFFLDKDMSPVIRIGLPASFLPRKNLTADDLRLPKDAINRGPGDVEVPFCFLGTRQAAGQSRRCDGARHANRTRLTVNPV